MNKTKKKQIINKTGFLMIVLLIIIFSYFEFKQIYWGGLDRDIYFNFTSTSLLLFYFFIIGFSIVIFFLHQFGKNNRYDAKTKYPLLRFVLFSFIGIYPSILFQFSPWGIVITSFFLRSILFISSAFVMTYLLNKNIIRSFKIYRFFPSIILISASLVLSNRIRLIVNYPFPFSWSEGNRFWDYSLFLWKDHYQIAEGSNVAAFLDIGRQSLWGLAFLCKNLTIAGMRAWNALLYFLPPFCFGLLIFKHKKIKLPTLLLFGLWTYVFLSQGPIYAPLLFCAIFILVATEINFLPASLFLIILAGYYANLTRFTWIVAPPTWAFLLFYFRKEYSSQKQRVSKSLLAAICGLIGAIVLPNLIPMDTTSILIEENTSSGIINSIEKIFTSQDLLWNRLLPSQTFRLGILPALFIIVAPLLITLYSYLHQQKGQLLRHERFLIIASLLGFLSVGSVVSVKIGGGSNLHNMDMFLLSVLIIISIFWKKNAAEWFQEEIEGINLTSIITLFLLLYLGLQNINSAKPTTLPSTEIINNSLSVIQDSIDERKETGDILFIDHRQLLTFGYIDNVELVGEYEKKLMMNEALSNNQIYFDDFYQDLENHRFSLIINEPINITYQEDEASYGEENDAYVKWVSEPLLCYYEPLITYQEVGVELLIPRTSPVPDHLNCP